MKANQVQAVIFDKSSKKFLLIHRCGYFDKKFLWRNVKGTVNEKESDIEALRREIKEETNLSRIKINGKIFSYSYLHPKNIKIKVNCYLVYASENDELKNNDKKENIDGYKWVDGKTAVDMLFFDEEKEAINKAMKFMKISI